MIKPRLKNIHCLCRVNSIPNLFHSSQTLLANLNFPTSKRYLFLNSLKLCPCSSTISNEKSIQVQNLKPLKILKTLKNLSRSKISKPLKILKTSIRSACRNLVSSSKPQDPQPVHIPGFIRIYQDPSMKIPSWMAIGRGKKQTLINTPSRSSSDDQASS